jgi:hypothetical protein
MIRRAFKLIGVWVALSFGQPQQEQVPPQPQVPQQTQGQAPPPQAQVEVEVPKEVKEYLELKRELLKKQKRSEIKKIDRQEKFDDLQSSLSSLQHQKNIMLEKKHVELLKKMPPVFYSVEIAGVVGNYALSRSGIVMGNGYKVGTAEVSKISIEEGVLLKDGQVVYPADSTGVRIVLNELYQEAKQTQTAPPPPPNIFSPPTILSPSTSPPPPPVLPPPPPR